MQGVHTVSMQLQQVSHHDLSGSILPHTESLSTIQQVLAAASVDLPPWQTRQETCDRMMMLACRYGMIGWEEDSFTHLEVGDLYLHLYTQLLLIVFQ